jgi:GxxExxY protein
VRHEQLTHTILGAAMEVHRTLGTGFLESIYRNALLHELHLRGLSFKSELEVQIPYKDLVVGKHRLDILVEDVVVVELKAVSQIIDIHIAQAISYLRATGADLALIINFGEESLSWKRLINSPGFRR